MLKNSPNKKTLNPQDANEKFSSLKTSRHVLLMNFNPNLFDPTPKPKCTKKNQMKITQNTENTLPSEEKNKASSNADNSQIPQKKQLFSFMDVVSSKKTLETQQTQKSVNMEKTKKYSIIDPSFIVSKQQFLQKNTTNQNPSEQQETKSSEQANDLPVVMNSQQEQEETQYQSFSREDVPKISLDSLEIKKNLIVKADKFLKPRKSKKKNPFIKTKEPNFVRANVKNKFKERRRGAIKRYNQQVKNSKKLKMGKNEHGQRFYKLADDNEEEKELQEQVNIMESAEQKSIKLLTTETFQKPYYYYNFISSSLKIFIMNREASHLKNEFNRHEFEETTNFIDDVQQNLKQRMLTCLQQVFQKDAFRVGQEESLLKILNNESCLVILPTGTGKSLIYQLPIVLKKTEKKCMALVVSPLISLMIDQLKNLPPGTRGACLNSSLEQEEKVKIKGLLKEGVIDLLYISPEILMSDYIDFYELPEIQYVCIDEAHCISEWSHNFRTSYLKLYENLKAKLERLPPILALTATSTYNTSVSMCKILGIKKQNIIQTEKVNRDNLKITVSKDLEKSKALMQILKAEPFKKLKSIIIYCNLKWNTESISNYLNFNGIKSVQYHAGLTKEQRMEIQQDFMDNKVRVVVATVAFGMGIDKQDIDCVIHMDLPRSPESYIQEIGRAGRDGRDAYCHLFLNDKDYIKLRNILFTEDLTIDLIRQLLFKIIQCSIKFNQQQINQDETLGKEANENSLKRTKTEYKSSYSAFFDDICSSEYFIKDFSFLSIQDMSKLLDVKRETIETILYRLSENMIDDFNQQSFIKSFSNCWKKSFITFYKTSYEECKQNLSILQNLDQFIRKTPQGKYKASLEEYCSQNTQNNSNFQPYNVVRELQKLQNLGKIKVEFDDEAFVFKLQEIPTKEQFEELTRKIYDQYRRVLLYNIFRTDCLYLGTNFSAYPNVENLVKSRFSNQKDNTKYLKDFDFLPKLVQNYFNEKNPTLVNLFPNLDDNPENYLPLLLLETETEIAEFLKTAKKVFNDIVNSKIDLKNQISSKEIVCILQGVQTQNFHYKEWKTSPYWESFQSYKHEQLRDILDSKFFNHVHEEIQQNPQQRIKTSDLNTYIVDSDDELEFISL